MIYNALIALIFVAAGGGQEPPEANSQAPVSAPPPAILTNLNTYFSDDDYPRSALRNGEEGVVLFDILIGEDGTVRNCAIVSSSGSAALDNTTCQIATSRMKFMPARDPSGNSVADTARGSIRWTLPKD